MEPRSINDMDYCRDLRQRRDVAEIKKATTAMLSRPFAVGVVSLIRISSQLSK
jgi:hypothetical protein